MSPPLRNSLVAPLPPTFQIHNCSVVSISIISVVPQEGDDGGEGSGGGGGGGISVSNSVILRFYLYLRRAWSPALGDHASPEFQALASNTTDTLEQLYTGTRGAQFITLADIRYSTVHGGTTHHTSGYPVQCWAVLDVRKLYGISLAVNCTVSVHLQFFITVVHSGEEKYFSDLELNNF